MLTRAETLNDQHHRICIFVMMNAVRLIVFFKMKLMLSTYFLSAMHDSLSVVPTIWITIWPPVIEHCITQRSWASKKVPTVFRFPDPSVVNALSFHHCGPGSIPPEAYECVKLTPSQCFPAEY